MCEPVYSNNGIDMIETCQTIGGYPVYAVDGQFFAGEQGEADAFRLYMDKQFKIEYGGE